MESRGRKVNGRGPKTSRILIVGECPGDMDEKWGMPAMGLPGKELGEMLSDAKIDIRECYLTNVCKYRPPRGDINNWIAKKKSEVTPEHVLINGLYILPIVEEGYRELEKEIETIRPNIILALGNLALWACTGRWGIQDWRGSLEENQCGVWSCKVIPSLHPAFVLRNYETRSLCMVDLRRVFREQHSREIEPIVERFTIPETYNEAVWALGKLQGILDMEPTRIAFDIETAAEHITCIGFAWSAHDAICIPLFTASRPEGYWSFEQEAHLVYLIYKMMTHPNFIGLAQNGSYDCQYIEKHWLYMPNFVRDTMISAHALMPSGQTGDEDDKKKRPGFKKSLGILSSIYRPNHKYWKQELEESMED